jgi:hypothetical protein
MCDTTLENIKQLKDPFIWCAADGSVLVADGGVPVECFDASLNWIKIWVDKLREKGYNVDGWKIYCNGTTNIVSVVSEETIITKV